MAEKTEADVTIPGGILGLMGYRLFDLIINLASKAHWFFLIYWIPPHAIELVRELNAGTGNTNILNLNLKDIPTIFDISRTIGVLSIVVVILVAIIIIQRFSLNYYKKKVKRLEEGIVDPLDDKRGSSSLTVTEATNPGDKP